MKDSNSEEVFLQDVDADTLVSLLEFIYTASISISAGNVQSMFIAAQRYQMDLLCSDCETFMIRQLSRDNSLSAFLFAKQFSALKLAKLAKRHVLKEFKFISQQIEFLELPSYILIELLASYTLDLATEDELCDMVLRWFNQNKIDRISDLPLVMKQLRTPLISSQKILAFVAESLREMSAPPFGDLKDNAKYLIQISDDYFHRSHDDEECQARTMGLLFTCWKESAPRIDWLIHCQLKPDFTFDIISNKKMVYDTSAYPFTKNCFRTTVLLATHGVWFFLSEHKDHTVFSISAEGGELIDSTVFYKKSSDGWVEREMFVHNDHFYQITNKSITDVEMRCIRFNSVTGYMDNKLRPVDVQFPTSLLPTSAKYVSFNNCVFMIGGYYDDSDQPVDTMYRWQDGEKEWVPCAPMLYARNLHTVVATSEYIYVIGGIGFEGNETFSSVERYNPVDDAWELMEPIPGLQGYTDNCAVVYRNHILLSIVENLEEEPDYKGQLFMYDTSLNHWQQMPFLPGVNIRAFWNKAL